MSGIPLCCVTDKLVLIHYYTTLEWYNDSLRAGQSGDRIPVGARFSAPIQNSPGYNGYRVFLGGELAGA